MSLEWDGFRLALGREGLVFTWPGGGCFEAGVTHCVSASLRRPRQTPEGHRLVFRFHFPGTAADAESVVIRTDVPPGEVEQARRFRDLLWREYGVPDEPDTEAETEVEGAPEAERVAEATEPGAEEEPDTDADAGAAAEAATVRAELGRVPDTSAWIISPAGVRSDELFQDVMARLANNDR
ncbi:hypothetical protein [Streptomyces sp. NPDC003863]